MKKGTVFTIFIITLMIMSVGSCKNKSKTDEYKELKIDLNKSIPKLKLTKIAANPTFIKLYTDSLFLIGDIRNIVYKKKIYVQNFTKILVFNPDGSPVYALNKKGRGRHEYYEINDFHVDTVNNIIEVWDRIKRKMFVYDDSTGDFIRSYKWDLDVRYFKKTDGSYFFYSDAAYVKSGEKAEKIYCVDQNGEVKSKYLRSSYVNLYSFNTPEFLSVYKEEIYYDDAPLSIIYKINDKKCEIAYKIDIDNSTLTKDEFLSMKNLRAPDRFMKLVKECNFSTGETNIGKHGIKFELYANNNWYICFYNPENNNYFIGNEIFEDSYLNMPIWYRNICNGEMICYIDSYEIIKSSVNYENLSTINPELHHIIKNLHKFDNPILIISDLKKF